MGRKLAADACRKILEYLLQTGDMACLLGGLPLEPHMEAFKSAQQELQDAINAPLRGMGAFWQAPPQPPQQQGMGAFWQAPLSHLSSRAWGALSCLDSACIEPMAPFVGMLQQPGPGWPSWIFGLARLRAGSWLGCVLEPRLGKWRQLGDLRTVMKRIVR
jgi:hypothetical protein